MPSGRPFSLGLLPRRQATSNVLARSDIHLVLSDMTLCGRSRRSRRTARSMTKSHAENRVRSCCSQPAIGADFRRFQRRLCNRLLRKNMELHVHLPAMIGSQCPASGPARGLQVFFARLSLGSIGISTLTSDLFKTERPALQHCRWRAQRAPQQDGARHEAEGQGADAGRERSRGSLAFYRDGLGFPTEGAIGQEFEDGAVIFFHLNDDLILAL